MCMYVCLCVCLRWWVDCNTLQHTATHCNTLQHTATHGKNWYVYVCVFVCVFALVGWQQHTATHCNTRQHTATHGNTLQHTASVLLSVSHSDMRRPCCRTWPGTYCQKLSRYSTSYITLTWIRVQGSSRSLSVRHSYTHPFCNTLQHTATHCNTLQHTASVLLSVSHSDMRSCYCHFWPSTCCQKSTCARPKVSSLLNFLYNVEYAYEVDPAIEWERDLPAGARNIWQICIFQYVYLSTPPTVTATSYVTWIRIRGTSRYWVGAWANCGS